MKIPFEEYNPTWPERFRNECEIIMRVLSSFHPSVEHIGSTSVPGLGAKPVIDILVGLNKEGELDEVIDPMINCGYTYFKAYEPGMPYRRLFVKLKPLTDLLPPKIIGLNEEYISGKEFISLTHIHVIVKDTHHWTRHIAFRDFLRAYPEVRDEYNDMKRNLSMQEFSHHFEYNAGKDSFVKKTEMAAVDWYQRRQPKSDDSQDK